MIACPYCSFKLVVNTNEFNIGHHKLGSQSVVSIYRLLAIQFNFFKQFDEGWWENVFNFVTLKIFFFQNSQLGINFNVDQWIVQGRQKFLN